VKQIVGNLSRQLPPAFIKEKKIGSATVQFIEWHTACKILDKYAPGWEWQIASITLSSDRIFLVGVLTIPTSDGTYQRSATGTELLSCSSYGDPSSNAESMAFRRCCAKFGLARYLYQR
jgi:hypothetical protein